MKRVLPRVPLPQSMDSPEREYMRNLLRYQKAYVSLLSSGLNQIIHDLKVVSIEDMPIEMRTDSYYNTRIRIPHFDANIEKSIRDLFESVQNRLRKLFPDKTVRKWAEQMATHVNDVSKKNITKVGDAVGLEIEPLMRDGELTPYFRNIVDENVGLIRSIPEEKMAAFKNTLVYAITNDAHNKNFHLEIEKYISKNIVNTKARARLIAVDQVNKLNGVLNQYRQQKLGGKRYRWRNSGDERVAGNPGGLYPNAEPSHWDREGKIYYWDNPPPGGHPGRRVRCRCHGELILEDILD